MTLKTRITLISVATTFVVAAILVTVGEFADRLTHQRLADAVLDGNALIWEQLVADQLDATATAIAAFDDEFDLRSAIKQRDAARVTAFADRFVRLTGDGDRYDLLQILDPARALMYSSDRGLSLRHLDALLDPVVADGQPRRGILLADDGTPMAVVAFAVRSRKSLTGLALYARRLDGVITRLAQRSGAGAAIRGATTVTSHAMPALDDLTARLPAPGARTVTHLAAAGHEYVFSAQPVVDATGAAVAHLLMARDDTTALRALRHANLIGKGVALLAILAGVLVLFFSVKRYLAPLHHTAAAAARIAEGDLTGRVATDGVAEMATLQQAMDRMAVSLRTMVGDIGQVSGQIRGTASAMEGCVNEAEQGIGEQNTRSEAISRALAEMAASVAEEAQVTEQAAGTAVAMRDEADQGHALLQDNVTAARELSDEMAQVSTTIEDLNGQVALVTEIIGVINGIAEQTNLLALNAAIEAARAGEQGRGFSVVADEVRALAGRTQTATTEVEQIIQRLLSGATDSVTRMRGAREHVRANMDKAHGALQRFDGIKTRIDDLVMINQTIAAAVEEQGIVSRDVSDNMHGIQQLAQENNRRTRYLSSTTHDLNQLAGSLARITGRFSYQSDDAADARH